MKKVPGKYFWLLMTITGALMFGAPALVSASEGIASTDTENSAADNAADTPDDDTIAKTTDSAEKNSQETDHSGEGLSDSQSWYMQIPVPDSGILFPTVLKIHMQKHLPG